MYGYNQQPTYVQLFSATFFSLHNKIQWALLSSHILYCKKQKAWQCPGNEATFMHHVQIFACTIFSACILSLLTFMKNASIEHWVCRCGKRKMTLKPLSLWENVLSLIITMAWTLFACMLHDSSSSMYSPVHTNVCTGEYRYDAHMEAYLYSPVHTFVGMHIQI